MNIFSKSSRLTIAFNCYNPEHKCREQYSFSFLVYTGESRTYWLLVKTRGAGHGVARKIREQFPAKVGSAQSDQRITVAKVRTILEEKFSFVLDCTTGGYENPDPEKVKTYVAYTLIERPLRAHAA